MQVLVLGAIADVEGEKLVAVDRSAKRIFVPVQSVDVPIADAAAQVRSLRVLGEVGIVVGVPPDSRVHHRLQVDMLNNIGRVLGPNTTPIGDTSMLSISP